MMKLGLIVFAALLAASPAMARATVCLHSRDIVGAQSADGKILTVTMRDGKVWHNDMHGQCPGLKFNGFVWVLRGSDLVCENSQSLRVIQSGEICVLGKFTEQVKAAK